MSVFTFFPTFKALSLTFMSKISGPLADFQKWCQRKGRAWWSTSARSCSPACPCRPAFVCNYCLIKHAGQLPVSDWLASDTQLYTECLQPQSIRVRPFCFTLWSFAQTTVVITITAASICNTISLTNAWVLQTERLLLFFFSFFCQNVYFSFSCGQTRSLCPHKGNTIILKRLWSLVIEFSKGTRVLLAREGQLLDRGELSEKAEWRRQEEYVHSMLGMFTFDKFLDFFIYLYNLENSICLARCDITSG